jgi:hypothetical protein
LTTRPGDVRLIVHDPIATEASAEPDMRQVRALAQRVRAIVSPLVEEEAAGPPHAPRRNSGVRASHLGNLG